MAKEIIERHITQAPYRVKAFEQLVNKRFIQTGSTYGRFLFTEHQAMLEVPGDAHHVLISHCDFICLPNS